MKTDTELAAEKGITTTEFRALRVQERTRDEEMMKFILIFLALEGNSIRHVISDVTRIYSISDTKVVYEKYGIARTTFFPSSEKLEVKRMGVQG